MRIPSSTRLWGAHNVSLNLVSFQALKLRWVLEDLKSISGKVLDIGCGGGGMAKAMKRLQPDLEVWGLDNDRESIEWAKKNPEGVKFVLGDARKMKLPGKFNAVCMFDVLEHFEEPEEVLGQVRKVLGEKGLFHLFIPLEKQPGTLYWLILNKLNWEAKKRQAGHLKKYDLKEVKKLLEDNGFKVEKVRFSNHYIFQAVDLFFHLVWEWFPSSKPRVSVETYLAMEKNPWRKLGLGFIKDVVALLFYLESTILQNVPGGGVSVTAAKKT